jgi:O-antigen/teichoic acid export membrane protein
LVSLFNARLLFFILPAVQLGVWSNTLNIAEGLFLIAGSLGQILYSMFTRKDFRETNNESFFRKAFITNLLLTLLCGIVIFMLPNNFWIFVFGKGFMGMQQFLRLLSAGLIAQSVYLLLSYRLSAQGLFSKNLNALLWGAGINISVTVILIYSGKYSVQTGAISLSLGWIVSAIAALFFVKNKIPNAFEFKFRKR